MKEKAFSQLVREHKNAENYTALFVASLISEGCGDHAIDALKNHYGVKGDIADASDTVRELIISYQHVIDGTDDPVKRRLATDIHGNSVIDSPVSRVIESAPTKRKTIWSGLKSALRGTKE